MEQGAGEDWDEGGWGLGHGGGCLACGMGRRQARDGGGGATAMNSGTVTLDAVVAAKKGSRWKSAAKRLCGAGQRQAAENFGISGISQECDVYEMGSCWTT